jgi:hypothetical protein
MEEILASIRQIISEDGEGSQTPESTDAGNETAASAAEDISVEAETEESAAEPEAVASEPDKARAESHPKFEPAPEPESVPVHGESMTPQSYGSVAEAEPYAPYAASASQHEAARDGRNLLSQQSDQAVHGAFSALAHTILAQNARTLEDLVQEMLQPMLKSWLDDNLPALVERLVQEEIQRVSRGRP